MSPRTTTTLFVLVCLLCGLIWIMHGNRKQDRQTSDDRLFKMEIAAVNRLSITQNTFYVECVKSGNNWTIVKPVKTRADAAVITSILQTLLGLQAVETITSDQRQKRELTLEDYGVDATPRAAISLGSSHTNLTLLIGRDALDDVLYSRFAESSSVVATSTNALRAIPKHLDDLRDKMLLSGDVSQADRLEIGHQVGGFIQIIRKDGQWIMQQPVKGAKLRGQTVSNLLNALYGLRAETFVSVANLQQAGLDETLTTLSISVWAEGDTTGQTILLGKEVPGSTGENYARLADSDTVCTVRKESLALFSVKANQLRDTTLFSIPPSDVKYLRFRQGERTVELNNTEAGWYIVQPRTLKASKPVIDELLSRLTATRIVDFVEASDSSPMDTGLSTSERSIELATRIPAPAPAGSAAPAAKPQESRRILILGKHVPNSRNLYARFENENSVLAIQGETVDSILAGSYLSTPATTTTGSASSLTNSTGEEWMNPLLYCDRNVLQLDMALINTICLSKNGTDQTIRRDDSGPWQPILPTSGTVKTDIVDSILVSISNLNALRIESRGNDSLASYGLDDSTARLTVGLSGNKDIRKTLIFGFLAGTDGVYAMIQGQDLVFVLPRKLAGTLLRTFVAEEDHGL